MFGFRSWKDDEIARLRTQVALQKITISAKDGSLKLADLEAKDLERRVLYWRDKYRALRGD